MSLEHHLEAHKVESYELAADELQDKARPRRWSPTSRQYRRAFTQYLALRRKQSRAWDRLPLNTLIPARARRETGPRGAAGGAGLMPRRKCIFNVEYLCAEPGRLDRHDYRRCIPCLLSSIKDELTGASVIHNNWGHCDGGIPGLTLRLEAALDVVAKQLEQQTGEPVAYPKTPKKGTRQATMLELLA